MRFAVGLLLCLSACQQDNSATLRETTSKPQDQNIYDNRITNAPAGKSDNSLQIKSAPPNSENTVDDPCLDSKNINFNPDTCVEPEVSVRNYAGAWQITHVSIPDSGVQAFTTDDPAIVGSVFFITSKDIRWTKTASNNFTADDVCELPSASEMPKIVEKEEGGNLVTALRRFNVSGLARGAMHRFGCSNGGRWGPGENSGSLFIPIGTNQMALSWYDGVTLLAERTR